MEVLDKSMVRSRRKQRRRRQRSCREIVEASILSSEDSEDLPVYRGYCTLEDQVLLERLRALETEFLAMRSHLEAMPDGKLFIDTRRHWYNRHGKPLPSILV
jgi:hypothetical protein